MAPLEAAGDERRRGPGEEDDEERRGDGGRERPAGAPAETAQLIAAVQSLIHWSRLAPISSWDTEIG